MNYQLKFPPAFAKYLAPILAGLPSGVALSEASNWKNPLAVTLLGSMGGALLLGLLDRALLWRRDSRQSAERIAEIMSAMHKDMLDRQDAMRLEQRAYYRELLADVFKSKEVSLDVLSAAEIKRQLVSTDAPQSPSG